MSTSQNHNNEEIFSTEQMSNFICNETQAQILEDQQEGENNKNNKNIIFNFKKEKMKYDVKTVLSACPVLNVYVDQIYNQQKDVTVNMPDWINTSDLLEYFFYFKNSNSHSFSIKARRLLQIADFFENENLIENLINNELIPYLSNENALVLLSDAFEKLNEAGEDQNDLQSCWFELFVCSVNYVSEHLLFYIENKFSDVKIFTKKLLEEIMEKFFYMSDFLAVVMVKSDMKVNENFSKIVLLLNEIRDETVVLQGSQHTQVKENYSIYEKIIREQELLLSPNSINEILSTNPIFQININLKLSNFYQEFNVPFNKNIFLTFFIFCRDDTLNVGFKLNSVNQNSNSMQSSNNSITHLISFLSVVSFKEEKNKNQICLKSICNTKTLINIFKINQFKEYSKNKTSLTLQVNLKVCYIHSALINYTIKNFQEFYHEETICKINKNLYGIIIATIKQNKNYLFNISDDMLVVSLNKWMNDEINLNEAKFNLKDILGYIDWKKVRIDIIADFAIKFYIIIENSEMEHYFEELLAHKLKDDRINSFELFAKFFISKTNNF